MYIFKIFRKMSLKPKMKYGGGGGDGCDKGDVHREYTFAVFDGVNTYSTNEQYRSVLRKITNMKQDKIEEYDCIRETGFKMCDFETMDDETVDEMTFDSNATKSFLDYVYLHTKDNFDFQELYELAAAKMISTDYEIGLAVLFSFDYLRVFYPVLCDYMANKKGFTDRNLNYIKCFSMIK